MRLPKILPALLLCLVSGAWTASSAHAATANFAGNCTLDYSNPSTANCVFDALRGNTSDPNPSSCPGSSITQVFWDFGDGNSTWSGTFVGHTYVNPMSIGGGATSVKATVFCADNTVSPTKSRLIVFVVVGCPGCIQMNVGWN